MKREILDVVIFLVILLVISFIIYLGVNYSIKYENLPCKKYKEVVSIDYQTNFWGTRFFVKYDDGSIYTTKASVSQKVGGKECDKTQKHKHKWKEK